MEVVILGMGAAALSALDALRTAEGELGSAPAHVTVVAPEEGPSCSPCALPFNLCGDVGEDHMGFCEPDALTRLGADRVVARATALEDAARRVTLSDGAALPYDRLLIATGSVPFVPPVKGLDTRGVHFLASLNDSRAIRDWVDSGNRRCVVVGAGFVGIEAAVALRRLGCAVTVVEMLEWVLPRVLDRDVAGTAQRHLEAGGINFRLGCQVTRVEAGPAGTVVAAVVGDERIECDTVVVGIGVRPNAAFLKGSGVKVHHGIVVGDDMRTSAEGVYAAGDVAEARSRHTGSPTLGAIWPNALAQGRVAGAAMAGMTVPYDGSEMLNIVNLFEVPAVSLGLTSALAEQERRPFRTVDFRPPGGRVHRRLLLEGGRIIGAQMVGDASNASAALNYIRNGWEADDVAERMLRGPLPQGLLRTGPRG